MAKTTYKERQKRRLRAAELLAGGLSPADAVSRLTAEWGCSRRTSLRDVNLGQDALLESIDYCWAKGAQRSSLMLTSWGYETLVATSFTDGNIGAGSKFSND